MRAPRVLKDCSTICKVGFRWSLVTERLLLSGSYTRLLPPRKRSGWSTRLRRLHHTTMTIGRSLW
jgi:hypothetical protein